MRCQNLLFCLLLLGSVLTTHANAEQPPLRIVTEAYPPFVYEQDGMAMGADWEIVASVFRDMGVPIRLYFCPWKRCLVMMQNGYADAILDVSKTPQREARMLFPEESISTAPTVLFRRAEHNIPFSRIEDLSNFKAGTILGYSYCEQLNNAPFKIEEGQSLESNFRKLLWGRIDFVVAISPVGHFTAQKMGIDDRVSLIPGAVFCEDEANYLAFARDPDNAAIADRFSRSLRDFKGTERHREILERYGIRAKAATEH